MPKRQFHRKMTGLQRPLEPPRKRAVEGCGPAECAGAQGLVIGGAEDRDKIGLARGGQVQEGRSDRSIIDLSFWDRSIIDL